MPFSDAVCEKLGNYVYRLIDPRNGETFYVGRGKNNRVFDHVNANDELQLSELDEVEDALSAKLDRIRSIRNAHLKVVHVIHRHEIPEIAIAEVEAALIDAFSGLTNEQLGAGSSSRGPMHVEEVIAKYELPDLEYAPPEGLLLINVNLLENRADHVAMLHQVRWCWTLNPQRANKAEYVLAVVRGVVVGAFKACAWLPATRIDFMDLQDREPVDAPGRYAFKGQVAPPEIWERFVGARGKRITNKQMQHVQNPIRYWKIPT